MDEGEGEEKDEEKEEVRCRACPHVVLEGRINLDDPSRNFKKVSLRVDDLIIKLDELFINTAENRMLVKGYKLRVINQYHSILMLC
ncbi:hypothetical protein HRbin04_00577 [archaeon HR04]|nr:hypothetical protein HRbin04_00577 [archaeon HR04]